ncbi:MAG: TIM barrel protein [Alphaproteobacteria bacterium]|nr:TIM barrel protein [Alphaproteobacteria bacterium]
MRKYGAKFWSKNILNTPEIIEEISIKTKEGIFDFVEIFAFNNTFDDTAKKLHSLFKDVHVNIHASHGTFDFNPSLKQAFQENLKQFNEAQKFADLFHSEVIVTHPGFDDSENALEETIRQFNLFNDKRLTVENLPRHSFYDNHLTTFQGSTPEEISQIMRETNCNFCLDFSHAICAANSLKAKPFDFLSAFANYAPDVYHICDGTFDKEEDEHLHIGKGDYPLKKIVEEFSAQDAMLTLETGKYPSAIDWEEDVRKLRGL